MEKSKCPNCLNDLTCSVCECNLVEVNLMRDTFENWYAKNHTNVEMGDKITGTLAKLRASRTPTGYRHGWFDYVINDDWDLFCLAWTTCCKMHEEQKENKGGI